jgi:hypothetical protein
LATKDYKEYVLESVTELEYYTITLQKFNQNKVKSVEKNLGGNHTESIDLGSNSQLNKIGTVALQQKDIISNYSKSRMVSKYMNTN